MELSEKLKQLPNESGVYQYFDKEGHLLYVGKAKVLKNRVKSYFKFTPTLAPADKLGLRIYKMITEVASLEWIIVPNEHDALILENSLIKQLKPKYNILLRDDKTYPYIYIDLSEDFPRLEITRKVLKGSNIKYFGPYSTGARDILDSIYEIVPLVQKKTCIKGKTACLFHQIKKCHAPCEGKITIQAYKEIVNEALEYIYNKSKLLIKLNEKMQEYSNDFRFEEAMNLRDRIKTIEKSQIKTGMDLATNENLDLFAIKTNAKKAVVVRMFIRDGKLASSNHNFIKLDFLEDNSEIELDEAYQRAMVNYYTNEIPVLPKEILIAQDLEEKENLEAFLTERFSKKIPILNPKVGKKKELMQIALNNCEELLRLESSKNNTTIYEELQKLFQLQRVPARVESFDNSHMMGQATVGAMVIWEDGFVKSDFRHYNLEALDEYAQMHEMLKRRVESFQTNPAPDLWIIDGGLTLLKLAYNIVESVGVNIDIIAIAKEKIDAKAHRAKGKAKDILHYKEANGFKELKLSSSDQRLQFVQRQRDEAHRFVIAFHKKQKRKEDKQISLLQLHGIGEAKVKKLLLYFGTFEEIKRAKVETLKEVLNEKDAIVLFNHFTSNKN
ncbi:MAG: excinuclease ABC subunit UvrC [Candidatus Marinarcus sp.]|uniref:excinuclease ABC subunit UvrC n=1 Tax=Candidatus Marinarcus sp. TaxID=3100987 RepID=UPI003AFFD955